ncbi:MAG TPA: redoxin domain-containing protein [Gemmatimonadales bacterium]|nr:redoxin domain-containing protein [Gemmatimonadales bacterium]
MRILVLLGLLAVLGTTPGAFAQAGYTPTAFAIGGPDRGDEAPDFALPWASRDTIGEQLYTLGRDRGRVVVLAFYPRDFTRSDSIQLSRFRDDFGSLFGDSTTVVGISTDPVETHRRFATRLQLPFRLLSDAAQEVAAKYGSKDQDNRNRRTVYVIGGDGRVVYRDLRFSATDDKAYERLQRGVERAWKR